MGAMKAALDITLVSLRKVGPVVSRLWLNAKERIASTKAKPLVCNIIVSKLESTFDTLHDMLLSQCIKYRARLLPKELEQLEKQVEQLKKEIEDAKKSISKNLRPVVATAWQYAKVEMIPPLTSQVFQGSLGNKIENAAAGVADKLIGGIEQQLKSMEAARIKAIQEKEAAAKVAAEKAKAEAIKKAAEEKLLEAAAAEKAATAAKQEKAKEVTKPAVTEEPPKEPPKAEAKPEAKGDHKKANKRGPPKTKKKAKTNRRKTKKGSAPKPKK